MKGELEICRRSKTGEADEARAITHHDEGAIEVKALATAFCHHIPFTNAAVVHCRKCKKQDVDQQVAAHEEQLAAVIVPVGWSQVTGGFSCVVLRNRWF